MAWTQQDLDNVNAAIARGTLTVEQGEERITYRSMDDLLKAKRIIQEELAQQNGSGRSRVTYARFSRG